MARRSVNYEQLRDGGGFEVSAKGEKIRFACCDCGLVHTMAFALEKNGNIGIALKRNVAATKYRRKAMKGGRQHSQDSSVSGAGQK